VERERGYELVTFWHLVGSYLYFGITVEGKFALFDVNFFKNDETFVDMLDQAPLASERS